MHTAAVMIHRALMGSFRCRAIPPTAQAPTTASTTPKSFFSIAPLSCFESNGPSVEQPAHGARIARLDGAARPVPSTTYHALTGAPHPIDRRASCTEDPAVQDLVLAPRDERG